MRFFGVISFLLIFAVIHLDVCAQIRCEDLFNQSQQVAVSQNEILEKDLGDLIQRLTEDIQKNSSLVLTSEEIHLEHQKVIERITTEYYPQISEILKNKEIDFELTLKPLSNASKEILYPMISILHSSQSTLNRYASGLQKKGKIDLIYFPFKNKMLNAKSLFDSNLRAIFLQPGDLFRHSFVDPLVTGHEIRHALFASERKGLHQPKNQYPVHIKYVNKEKGVTGYDFFYSFEEMVTYADTLTAAAKQLLRGTVNSAADYDKYFKITRDISLKSIDLLSVALDIVDIKPEAVLTLMEQAQIQLSEKEFFIIQIPRQDVEKYNENDMKYIKKLLEKAMALAQFNIKYLTEAAASGQPFQKVSRFKSAQVDFIEAETHSK